MRPRGFSMRWWLALTFALIAGMTTAVAAQVLRSQSADAFRGRAEDVSVGRSVAAAATIADSSRPIVATRSAAAAQGLSLFLFDAGGELVSQPASGDVVLDSVPNHGGAVGSALRGQRYISSAPGGHATVVALPVNNPAGGVLLAYNRRTDVSAEIGIVGRSVVEAGVLAFVVGATAGLLVSVLITRRTRRIADAAAEIERGRFDQPLTSGFHDELGELAETVDAMRERLDDSFSRLQSERDRLRRLLERLHEGVVTVGADGRVGLSNPAAARMLGLGQLSPGSPLPEPWQDIDMSALVRALCAPAARPTEARVSAGDRRTYSIVGIPASEPNGSCVLVLSDVTERERREAAEREFVANAAHELRTPTAAIAGAVEILRSGGAEDPEIRDRFLMNIERESLRLGRLTRSMLVLARAQTGEEPLELSAIDLSALLDEVIASLGPDEARLVARHRTDVKFLGQSDLAYQLLSNVIANAVRHGAGRPVTVSAARAAEGSVSIEVRDQGAGIPYEHRERVFDRFYRGDARDDSGFGLGLAIVREVVRELGGDVEIESPQGGGTTVRMKLIDAR